MFRLFFGPVLAGELGEPFVHQGTWFATFTSRLDTPGNDAARRVAEFVTFSEVWHRRLRDGEDPDAAEYDAFGDVVRSDLWRVEPPPIRAKRGALDGAPVFAAGEASWRFH